jgi:hypothetical protein
METPKLFRCPAPGERHFLPLKGEVPSFGKTKHG